MKLEEFKILPGTVIDVSDPKYIGRVKADAPGLFNSAVMNKEGMPWIYPAMMTGYQRFSKLNVGSKIWILTDKEYHEFWYVPMFELNQDTRDIISENQSDYQESEVLLSRNMGDMAVYIYYRPSEGIVLKNSDNTFITLTPDNQIIMRSGEGQVLIKDNQVYIGDTNTNTMEKAVMGESLVKFIDRFANALDSVASTSAAGYTGNLTAPLMRCVAELRATQDLLAKNTKVD